MSDLEQQVIELRAALAGLLSAIDDEAEAKAELAVASGEEERLARLHLGVCNIAVAWARGRARATLGERRVVGKVGGKRV
jgi:hypothetical protein